ncbi:hypothetical protein Tdes44962_MAKER02946 [Teratosphaeria destructans]|uniref:Myb-like DNA-binding domain-containing protein n=1 Tax=Teratosphaeria destructans TaxID=418781 RepID=A0A9W7W2E1_9PEZI|nr:hypothetical protein Tdes44962_MAKER02946 [Teratosphaeria destructans]
MADTNKSQVSFTEAETKFIILVIKHLEGNITTDFNAVAAEAGYKDANGARVRWNQIRREKILGVATGETPKKRKTKASEEAAEGESPKKRGRKTKAQKEAEAAQAADAKEKEGGLEEAVKAEVDQAVKAEVDQAVKAEADEAA